MKIKASTQGMEFILSYTIANVPSLVLEAYNMSQGLKHNLKKASTFYAHISKKKSRHVYKMWLDNCSIYLTIFSKVKEKL